MDPVHVTRDAMRSSERFRPIRLLGRGAMGEVWLVHDVQRGMDVAMKRILNPDQVRFALMFQEEYRGLLGWEHPNIIHLYDFLADGETFIFTMEPVDGHDLGHWIQGPPSEEKIQWFMIYVLPALLEALAYQDRKGRVHRDLKPSNILIGNRGEVKITDYGLSMAVRSVQPSVAEGRPGFVIGTPTYMSPEQARGEPVTLAADLYSLGVILFEFFTGYLPYYAGDVSEVLRMQIEAPVPQLSWFLSVPEELNSVVFWLMAKDPEQRPSIDIIRSMLGIGRANPVSSLPPIPHGLVGRRREQVALIPSLMWVRDTRPADPKLRVAFVSAPSGLGKSSLAEIMMGHAVRLGFQVYQGQSYEQEAIPYRAWDRIMTTLALVLQRYGVDFASFAPLSRLFPQFRADGIRRASGAKLGRGQDPLLRKREAFQNLRELLATLVRLVDRPVMLVLDDLQWTDKDSLELFEAIVELARDLPVMILALYRSDELPKTHPLTLFASEYGTRDGVQLLHLDPLTATEVGEMVRQIVRGGAADHLIGWIHEQTEGHPHFVAELARYLAEYGVTHAQGQGLPSLEALIEYRVTSLSAPARQLANLAAAAGGPIAETLLRASATLDPMTFDRAVRELVDARILRPTQLPDSLGAGTPDLSYDYYHVRIREIVYAGIEAVAAVHKRLADHLTFGPQSRSETFFHHWKRVGDGARATVHGQVAAEEAMGRLAFARASQIYQEVIAIRQQMGPPVTPEARQELVHLHEQLAFALEYQGEYGLAVAPLRNAIELACNPVVLQPEARTLQLHLAVNLVRIGEMEQGIEQFEVLLREHDSRLRRSFANALATIMGLKAKLALRQLIPHERRRPTAKDQYLLNLYFRIFETFGFVHPLFMAEYYLRFRLLASELSDPRAELFSASIDAIFKTLGGYDEASVRKAHEILKRAGDAAGSQRAQWSRAYTAGVAGFVDLAVGRWDEARTTLEAVVSEAERDHATEIWEAAACRVWLMLTYYYAGPESGAVELAERFVSERERNVVHYSLGLWVINNLRLRHGQLEEARATLHEWSQLVPVRPMTYARALYEASAHAVRVAEGQAGRVLEHYQPMQQAVDEIGFRFGVWENAHWAMPLLEAAIEAARTGRLDRAERARAIKMAKTLAKRENLGVFSAMGYRALALIHHYAGSGNDARRMIEKAVTISKNAGVAYHRWLCLLAAREIGQTREELERECENLERVHEFKEMRAAHNRSDRPMRPSNPRSDSPQSKPSFKIRDGEVQHTGLGISSSPQEFDVLAEQTGPGSEPALRSAALRRLVKARTGTGVARNALRINVLFR